MDARNMGSAAGAAAFPWLGAAGLGLSGIGSILDYFGGSKQRDYEEWLMNYKKSLVPQFQSELNKPAISQSQITGLAPQLQKGLSPYLNQLAGGASARLGLDSGAAQGEIARGGYGQLQGILAELMQQAMMMNAQKRQNVLGALAGLGG